MSKRLRSLASKLWDTDSPSPKRCLVDVDDKHELQLENAHLKEELQRLQAETHELRRRSMSTFETQHGLVDLSKFNEPWIKSLRQDVICLPRLCEEILPELLETGGCGGKVTFDIHPNPKATASQVACHVQRRVSALSSKHPAVYKVGITGNPFRRWAHSVYGYSRDRIEKWQGMKIIAITADSFSAALLETMLITSFKDSPGCRNERPGGESAASHAGPFFTYTVYRVLVPPPRVVSCGASSA